MEKFSTWRDPATGIHPFLPVTASAEPGMQRLIYSTIGYILLLLRLPCLLFVISGWLISCYLLSTLQLIFGPMRPLLRLIDTLYGHSVLFLLGYFYVPFRQMTFRSSSTSEPNNDEISLTLAKDKNISVQSSIHCGDLIICNHQSPIDIIILCTKLSPIFTAINPIANKVHIISRWRLLLNCASPGIKNSHSTLLPASLNQLNGPVVIFPEGSTSNGRALLPFIADIHSLNLPPNQRVHIFGLKHVISDGAFLPTLPINGLNALICFIVRLASQWYNKVLIKWISAECIYSCKHVSSPDQKAFLVEILKVMQSMLHLRTVTLSLSAKEAFLTSYHQRRRRGRRL